MNLIPADGVIEVRAELSPAKRRRKRWFVGSSISRWSIDFKPSPKSLIIRSFLMLRRRQSESVLETFRVACL